LGLASFVFFFWFSLDYSVLALFAFVVFSFSVPRQEIGWEERFQNNQFCVEWDAKP